LRICGSGTSCTSTLLRPMKQVAFTGVSFVRDQPVRRARAEGG
jgi:hypothetical protein